MKYRAAGAVLLLVACFVEDDAPYGFTALTPETHLAFPIVAGATHANTDCNACHGGLGSFRLFNCIGCHEHAEALLAPTHTGMSGYAWESPRCYGCHPTGVAALTREGHVWFPIVSSSPHGPVGCDECHSPGQPRSVWGCTQCHGSQAELTTSHTGVNDFAYDSVACYQCHPDGTAASGFSRDQHSPFPIADGTLHATVACSGCHTNPNDNAVVDCSSCHHQRQPGLDTPHAGIGDYAATNSARCMQCHPDGTVPITQAQHNTVSVNMRSPHNKCTGCHDVQRPDRPFPASTYPGFSCYGSCHEHSRTRMDSSHSGERGYAYDWPTCLRCHPEARK